MNLCKHELYRSPEATPNGLPPHESQNEFDMDQHSTASTRGMFINLLYLQVEALEKLYGSQLIWKIDNYAEKLYEAKAGKKPTIYSPPFLTSRHGYKMALSACLYGDGKGK